MKNMIPTNSDLKGNAVPCSYLFLLQETRNQIGPEWPKHLVIIGGYLGSYISYGYS